MSSKKSYAKTPTVYQMEATECGAASLAMVLAYYGKNMPLEQLRIETGVSRDGCNMKNIMVAARKFGMEVHGYRKELDGLFELPVPCIIHWNFNHFVVWEGRKGDACYINDPAMGRRKLTVQDIDDCFTGIVLTLEPTENFVKSNEKETLWTFLKGRLADQKAGVAALVILGLFLVVPGIIIPIFSQVFIDDILLGGNDSWMTGLITAMICTMVFQAVLTFYRGVLLQRIQNKMILLNGHRFLSHMLHLPINFFSQRYAGDLSQRITNNNNISTFLTGTLAQTILNFFVAAFYLILLFIYSPLLTVIGLAVVALNLLIIHKGAKEIGDITMKGQQDQGRLVGSLFAGLTITSTLKASGAENEYISRLEGNYAKSIATEQKMGIWQEALNAVPNVTKNLIAVLVLVIGGWQVIRGNMTAGMLVAFSALMTSFITPVNELSGFIQNIQTTKADMARVNDIMKYQEDEKFAETEYADFQGKLVGRVELDDLSYGYDILKPPLLEHFSFDLKPGRSIAFVGASGSGKSTAAKLCSGLFHPWSGEIRMDGVPLKNIPPAVLAPSVATVSQEITLFSGSIRENLTMWDKNILDSDLVAAAKDACIYDFIVDHPGAFDYKLAEGGSNLSGGQRQRMEIARALVTDPSILIMDEATSALDPVVEKQVLDNIKRRGCTCIIVAHRLSAIRDCDEIIVMDQGKIVQRGTHEELVAVPGHYQRLVQNI